MMRLSQAHARTPARTHFDDATVAVIPAHRDVSLEMMRSYVEIGDGCYWTVHAVAWSHDGCYWASAGADDTLRVWDATTHRQLHVYANRHRGNVLDVLWSPDGKYIGVLASGASPQRALKTDVIVMNALTGEEIYREADCIGTELAWSVAPPVGAFSPQSIIVFIQDPCRAWSHDGAYLIASGDGRSGSGDLEEAMLASAPPGTAMRGWSPAGSRNGHRVTGDTVWIVDRARGQTALRFPHGTSLVAWSPVNSRIASVHGKTVSVWEASTGMLLHTYRGHTGWLAHVACLSWAPSGQYIASGDSTGVVHIWRV